MFRILTAGALVALLHGSCVLAQSWKMQPVEIQTRWAAGVRPESPLPEYPRPQLVRQGWRNLNGLWRYAITPADLNRPSHYDGSLLVPYPLESALSGVRRALRPDQLLWYQRTLHIGAPKRGARILLHFGAVDYRATIYVNDREVGTHSGGYEAFTCDITDALKAGVNELLVKVFDPSDAGPNPHGKQKLRPEEIFYTASSGIWQTVWLETVPRTYIERISATPDVDHGQLLLQVSVNGPDTDYTLQAIVKESNTVVASAPVTGPTPLTIRSPRLWSPDDPFLYDLELRLLRRGVLVDQVKSYFGLRKVEVRKDESGHERIFLNGLYTYNLGVLDQGFWPEGLYTAPTDAALQSDVQAVKAMGFNTIRKHVKIEPERWYYYCDKLGLLVWQDMVPPAQATDEARTQFEAELHESVAQLHSHPSIVAWVLFNEGWGAYEQERLAQWLKTTDPSRLLDAHSGANLQHFAEWERHLDPSLLSRVLSGDYAPFFAEQKNGGFLDPGISPGSDMVDLHVYPDPGIPPAHAGRVRVLGEYGGIGASSQGHEWRPLAGWGYENVTVIQVADTYRGMLQKLRSLEGQGLSASVYTQLYDVEQEHNGLMSYDRAVLKIPLQELRAVNGTMVPTAHNYTAATRSFAIQTADPAAEARRYAALLQDYKKGNRSLRFLRQLGVSALEHADGKSATEAADEFLDRSPRPYSDNVWQFIQAVTRTSHDKGFDLLRRYPQEADAALGENAAEIMIRDVVGREEVTPHASDKPPGPDWAGIEASAQAGYGPLGAEKVYGIEMIRSLANQDWPNFGKYYVLYFKTAAHRSEYSIAELSYQIFRHVTDRNVLETAATVCGSVLSSSELGGQTHPTDLDTYANLLYKSGRSHEALEWEQEAVRLSEGHDPEIADHLQRMRAGLPTWLADLGDSAASARH